MAIEIIDTLKPKNYGKFPVVEGIDVDVDGKRLPTALGEKADKTEIPELLELVDEKLVVLRDKTSKFHKPFMWAIQNTRQHDIDYWKAKIDTAIDCGIDNFSLTISLHWDASKKELYRLESIALLNEITAHIKSKGINLDNIKIHCTSYDGSSEFKAAYKALISEIADFFVGKCETIIILNECELITDRSNDSWVIDCVNAIKAKGFKCSISLNSMRLGACGEKCSLNILENLSIICLNFYPQIGNKGASTTLNDCITAWGSSAVASIIASYRNKFPNSKIVISETGVDDYYSSYGNPELYDLSHVGETATNGVTNGNYLYAAITTVGNIVDGITAWYEIDGIHCQEMLKNTL